MRALTRSLVAGSFAVGALLASPADAATRCFGEASLGVVCVVTPSVKTGEETYCVYTGGSTCQDVNVPTVILVGEVDVYCGGPLACNLFDPF